MTRSVAVSLALLAILAPPALGDGGPVIGMDAGPAGVTVRGIPDRYVAMQSLHGTTIARIERDGGRVVMSRYFPRALVIPVVAYDGTATGLSADGRTLVATRQLRRQAEFVVLDTERLKRRATITLHGFWTLDALSPDGRMLYLIETKGDAYAVRAYDIAERRLLPEPVVDPSEPDEPMQGMPLTREMSRDGRWAYTLYDAEEPFIHALDTERGTAKCIDLDQLAGRDDLLALSLQVGPGGTIAVRHVERERPLLVVDPRTLGITAPRERAVQQGSGVSGWLIIAGGLGLIAFVALIRRRRVRDNVQSYAAS
jgi:hypothetical protein